MLDVRRLRLLREVSLRGSIAAAAEALSFSPSAVSQQLSKLERETGVVLLERGPRSVRLTPAAVLLVRHADAIVERLELAEAELREQARAGSRTFALGSFSTAGATIVPEALAAFTHEHPDVEVVVTGLDPLFAVEELGDRRLDLALVYEYDHVPLPETPELERLLLLEEPFRVVLPRDHPAASRTSVPLAELAGDTWVKSSARSSCHQFTVRACRAAGFEPRIGFEFDDYQTMQRLVASGAGVAFAPDMALESVHADVTVRPLAFRAPRRRIYATWRRDADSPLCRTMVRAVEAAAATRKARPRLQLAAGRDAG
jgi:DNA-binding transcriptional LysR family regulator